MDRYSYIAFDAQYYLRRNWCVIKDNDDFDKFKLIDSVMWTFMKVLKQYETEKILLLFDKRPYKKEKAIEEYKGDRYLVLNEEADLKDQYEKETDPIKKAELKKQLDEIEIEANKFRVFGEAKYEIICNFGKFGMVPLNEPGYEADDLAYLLSKLSESREEYILLVTGDSDWLCMANPYCDVWRNKSKDPEFRHFSKNENPKIDDFHLYQINDIYYGGHNNVNLPEEYKDYPIEDIIDSIIKKDKRFPEFKKYYEALNVDNYMDEIKSRLLRAMLNEGKVDKLTWLEYHDNNGLEVYPYYVWKYLSKLNPTLYKG